MNRKIQLSIQGNKLTVSPSSAPARSFEFPAAAISVRGERFEAVTPVAPPEKLKSGIWKAVYADGPFRFTVTVTPGKGDWFFKEVEVVSEKPLPTPDYLEVDCQTLPAPGMRSCGYRSTRVDLDHITSEEEGSGVVPGCGYPLVSADMFTGLEHPAAFNTLLESSAPGCTSWQLRHFPLWQEQKIKSVRAVTGFSQENIRERFMDYLETIRLPKMERPFINFCTFWNDPYLGSFEYLVDKESYPGLVEGFSDLGLFPDGYTLDAGWQKRKSFFEPKEDMGGSEGLKSFCRLVRSKGADPGLWVSTNGPVGMCMEFLKSQGIAVGGGISSHYSGANYAVHMDKKLEETLTRRFCELASPEYGVRFFKIDWDNECATSPEFDELYPTRNHVREATLDIMARMNSAIRKVNPALLTRNGRWPSPWFLSRSSHISLADGGDCEYSTYPALSQRDSSTTHRDTVYYCAHVRDNSFLPLDVYDNHEFSHAPRNPWHDAPGVWSNSCVWAVMRGSSYHQYTLQPESLENSQAEVLAHCMELLRRNTSRIVTGRSRMIGGNPAHGEIYGFIHPGKEDLLLALRNPAPIPQKFTLPEDMAFYEQSYPDWRLFEAGSEIIFAPHEVKVLRGSSTQPLRKFEYPFQLLPETRGKWACYLPGSRRPGVSAIHQIPEMKLLHADVEKSGEKILYAFGVKVPHRMRDFKLCFRIKGVMRESAKVHLCTSRFKKGRGYAIPVTEVPFGHPGLGERENPDVILDPEERFFCAELPHGGDVFCRLEFTNAPVAPEDLELWVTGCEAPAREPEKQKVTLSRKEFVFLPHPDGFPLSLKIW